MDHKAQSARAGMERLFFRFRKAEQSRHAKREHIQSAPIIQVQITATLGILYLDVSPQNRILTKDFIDVFVKL